VSVPAGNTAGLFFSAQAFSTRRKIKTSPPCVANEQAYGSLYHHVEGKRIFGEGSIGVDNENTQLDNQQLSQKHRKN
jgi:hypothetical protein